jgi:hypothetical protein
MKEKRQEMVTQSRPLSRRKSQQCLEERGREGERECVCVCVYVCLCVVEYERVIKCVCKRERVLCVKKKKATLVVREGEAKGEGDSCCV